MAITRITKGVIKPNENYDTHNIVSTGIVTSVGLDVNGNADVSGNLSVGGVLTYEDVTSIDSVGIITARGGIDCNGDIDVDGHTNLDNISIAGVTTVANDTEFIFGTNATATRPLKIKHQSSNTRNQVTANYIDFNVTDARFENFAGTQIAQFFAGFGVNLFYNGTQRLSTAPAGATVYGNLQIESTQPNLLFKDTNNDNDFSIKCDGGSLQFVDSTDSYTTRMSINSSGNVSIVRDLDVDGHTNLDNVSIAGVVTATTFSGSGASLTGIANANIAANAAIAGTKITPNFGSQTINSDNGAFLGGNLSISNVAPKIFLTDTDSNSDFSIRNMHGVFGIYDQTNSVNRLTIASSGNVSILNDLDVDGHTNLDNVSIAGVTTFSGNTTFGANGSITSSADFHLSSNSLRVTGGSTVVGEFKGTSIPTVQVTQTTNNTDLQLRANSEGGLVRTATNYPLILGANQKEKLRIDGGSYARIGINTSTFDNAGSQLKIEGRGTGTTSPPYLQIKGVGNANLHSYVDLIATSDSNAGNAYRGLGVVMYDEPTNVEWFAGRPYAGSDKYIIGRKTPASYRTESSEVANQLFRLDSDGKVTFGDGNNLASNYDATMLIDGGDNTRLTIYGSTSGTGTLAFSDGSGSGATKMAGFIQMNHTSTDNGPRLNMGLNDTTLVHMRVPGSNRGQLEVYGNFNESDTPAIEISDGGDVRKVYLTNSSGDFNALTRNGSQTKGQLKMFESGVLIHNMKNPDATSTLQTFRTSTYKVTSGSTYTSISPIQSYMQKGDPNNYGCFEEANCTLEVNGGGNDHYQPVGFVPRGYNLDTTSFGGQWAGEMWIHQTGSQNPESFGYSGFNNWATMSFKCRWDCAHWNAKPSGFWVEHYINYGRGNIGKIDASGTQSQFVIYLLPGQYKIRWNCVRGMQVHRPVSDGAALVMRDGGSFVTYNTLPYSSRNTAFDSEITPGSGTFAYCT